MPAGGDGPAAARQMVMSAHTAGRIKQGTGDAEDASWATIGEIARRFDVSLRTLRFYEDRGLLGPRREGTTRFYGPRERQRLQQVLSLKNLGFTLSEIRDIIADSERRPAGGPRLRADQVANQLAHLQRQKLEIEAAIEALHSVQRTLEPA